MQSKDLGELAQAEFIVKAMHNGLRVSEPFGDNQKYDFIVDNGNKLFRIQVKSTSCYIENGDNYKLSTSYGSSKKELYTNKDIDFFACYIQPERIWYIIPVTSVHTPSIRLYNNSNASKLTPFKEAWNLLN